VFEASKNPTRNMDWLVVSTILKNISQWEGLSHIIIMENKKCLKPPTKKKHISKKISHPQK
jgi:hypothetical protein